VALSHVQAYICGRSIAGIVGSITVEGMDFRILCFVASGLCDDPITRSEGYFHVYVSKCVWSRNLKHKATRVEFGLLRHGFFFEVK